MMKAMRKLIEKIVNYDFLSKRERDYAIALGNWDAREPPIRYWWMHDKWEKEKPQKK